MGVGTPRAQARPGLRPQPCRQSGRTEADPDRVLGAPGGPAEGRGGAGWSAAGGRLRGPVHFPGFGC